MIVSGRYYITKTQPRLNSNLCFHLAIFLMILVSSFRFNIGYDWSQYLYFVYPNVYYSYIRTKEPLSALYMCIAGQLRQPIVMFFLFALTTYTLIGKTIEKFSASKYESLMIYFCLFYLESLSILRQAVALAVVLYGYKYIKSKEFVKYSLCCIVAFLYHKSALIALPIYFIYYMKPVFVFLFSIVFVILIKILAPVIINSMFPNAMVYYESITASSNGNFMRLIYLGYYLYSFLLRKKNDKETIGFLKILSFGILLPFVLGGLTGGRFAMYFIIYLILLLPKINQRFTIEYKVFFLLPFYALFFFYLLISVYINKSDNYVPFRWYFLEDLNQHIE